MAQVYEFTHALMRRPGRSVVRGLRAGPGDDPSFEVVLREHAGYADALRAAGLEVAMLDPLEQFPDAIFVEDPALVFPQGAVLLNPGTLSRQGEVATLRPVLEQRFGTVLSLDRGHADGGDVLVMPDRAFIGLSARTDREGAECLIGLLDRLGIKAEVAETPSDVLHLKTASSLIDEETVLATASLAASGVFSRYRVIEVPAGEEGGANVLRANASLLVGAGYPRIIDLLSDCGAQLAVLPNAEIARIDAGFTCMSLRWREA